jgi:uncharacterized membrane protein YdjX (TVP38/TMEM64 family)
VTKLWRQRLEAGLIFLVSFAVAAFVVARKHQVEGMLHHVGFFAYPVAIVIFAVVASAPFSVTDALAVMNGVIFGPLWGSVVNALGLVLAAIIGYVVALRTSKLLDLESQYEKLPKWVRHFKVGSPMFLIVVRVIPGLGGTIATQTAAALRVPIWRQIYTMCAIAVPICTLLAIFGDQVSDFVQHNYTNASHYVQDHRPHFRPHEPGPTVTP